MKHNDKNCPSPPSSLRSRSLKIHDPYSQKPLHPPPLEQLLQPPKTLPKHYRHFSRNRASSIQKPISTTRPLEDIRLSSFKKDGGASREASTPRQWAEDRPVEDIVIPTFGNWKNHNLLYCIEPQSKQSLESIIVNNSRQHNDSQHSDRTYSKVRQPRIAKNCKLLSKFYSNDLTNRIGDSPHKQQILPSINNSQRESLKNSNHSNKRYLPKAETERTTCTDYFRATCSSQQHRSNSRRKAQVSAKQSCDTQSTRQSQEMRRSRAKKQQYVRMYLKQKHLYEEVLKQNQIKANIQDHEFNDFIVKIDRHLASHSS